MKLNFSSYKFKISMIMIIGILIVFAVTSSISAKSIKSTAVNIFSDYGKEILKQAK